MADAGVCGLRNLHVRQADSLVSRAANRISAARQWHRRRPTIRLVRFARCIAKVRDRRFDDPQSTALQKDVCLGIVSSPFYIAMAGLRPKWLKRLHDWKQGWHPRCNTTGLYRP